MVHEIVEIPRRVAAVSSRVFLGIALDTVPEGQLEGGPGLQHLSRRSQQMVEDYLQLPKSGDYAYDG